MNITKTLLEHYEEHYRENYNHDFLNKYNAISTTVSIIDKNIRNDNFIKTYFQDKNIQDDIKYNVTYMYYSFDDYDYEYYKREKGLSKIDNLSIPPTYRDIENFIALHDFIISFCPYEAKIRELMELTTFIKNKMFFIITEKEIKNPNYYDIEDIYDERLYNSDTRQTKNLLYNFIYAFSRDEYNIKIPNLYKKPNNKENINYFISLFNKGNIINYKKIWKGFINYINNLNKRFHCRYNMHENDILKLFNESKFCSTMPIDMSVNVVFSETENFHNIGDKKYTIYPYYEEKEKTYQELGNIFENFVLRYFYKDYVNGENIKEYDKTVTLGEIPPGIIY